jgi:hypothetical protein
MMKKHPGSRLSRKVWAVALCALLASTLDISIAQAASPSLQKMEYDVYAGGFHVVSADLTVDLTKKASYYLNLSAYTHGLLAKLAPWKGSFETRGWYDANKKAAQPEEHKSTATWRGELDIDTYRYGKDGSFKEYRVKEHDKAEDVRQPEEALTKDTIDVLTATLAAMQSVADKGACASEDEIFDGKRRYKIMFKDVKQDMLEKTRYNVYAGPAMECIVEVKQLAGKVREKPRGWLSIQEQGRERGTMPTIWFAALEPGQPAIPVKIRVKTAHGTMFMHLTRYENADKTLIARE